MSEYKIMSTPREVHIALTGRCNLNCAYCFYADEMTGRTDLPTQTWLRFFEELGNLGVMKVILTGGEAFMRSDFFELIDGVIKNHMRYSILSNGTLINEKTIESFKINKRRLRLNSVQISIDGSSSEIHDESRPHSFARAINGLRLLKQSGFPVTTRVTINRHNYKDLENIARLLLEDVGLSSFSTNEAFPCGATNRYEPGITLSTEQRKEVIDILTELNSRYPHRINANAGPLTLLEQDNKIKDAILNDIETFPNCGYLSACGGVFNALAILHDGTITPCHILSGLSLGNIVDDDLQGIWLNHPILQALRDRRTISLDEITPCRTCDYRGYCTGGCPGGALFFNNDINTRNPMDCYRILMGKEIFNPNSSNQAENEDNE